MEIINIALFTAVAACAGYTMVTNSTKGAWAVLFLIAIAVFANGVLK